jgi:virginiamycin B lyase
MPEGADDPHSMAFDGRGGIWFTVQHGNRIGRLDMDSREVRLVSVPTPQARPYGIVVDPDGRPWVALLGTHKLATVDPGTFEVTEIELPREDARPRRIGRTRDGRTWYVDHTQGRFAPRELPGRP